MPRDLRHVQDPLGRASTARAWDMASAVKRKISVGRMGFGPTYVAHIPPIVVWYSRDSLCYGVGARVAYITAKKQKSDGKSLAGLLE